MNSLSSYCGLFDAKIRASDKDLPILVSNSKVSQKKQSRWDESTKLFRKSCSASRAFSKDVIKNNLMSNSSSSVYCTGVVNRLDLLFSPVNSDKW